MQYLCFDPEDPANRAAGRALDKLLESENPTQSYSQMMRYRLSGRATGECHDRYFIAIEDGRCVSRLWHGWGRHPDAIGNFGNFRTAESHRQRGIGRRLLDQWFDDLQHAENPPLALFCTSSQPHLVRLYGEYGFRPALAGKTGGPLYLPLNDSPEMFQDFCRKYYTPAVGKLVPMPGRLGYRHEIDCLLKFCLMDNGRNFGLPAAPSYEWAFLHPEAGKLEILADSRGRIVGWALTPPGGQRQMQLHPGYVDAAL